MRSKNAFLIPSAAFFICFIFAIKSANAQQGSFYFSAGYNKAWYSAATIHVDQNEIANSYNLVNVKGDNKTKTSISALQLNYRLGYYCNDEQTIGLEFNFDPVNYQIKEGQNVTLKGTINGIPRATKTVVFSAKNGYYYKFDGANLMLLNIVTRTGIYHMNNRKVSVDLLIKGGVGPVMPHIQNRMPVDPVNDPQFQWAGWDAGLETGFRVSIYRYGYIELAGKYDYASLSGVNVYEGTANQHLNTFEAIASIGFTLPTSRYNPLFYRQRIITLIPLFVQKRDSADHEATQDSLINADIQPLTDIPEFPEIADRNSKRKNRDSLALLIRTNDSIATQLRNDSLRNDSLAQKNKPAAAPDDTTIAKPASVNIDSLENAMLQGNNKPAAPKVDTILSSKEKKRLEKKERKEKKKLEKQQEKDKKTKEEEDQKAKADKEAADNAAKGESTTIEKKETPAEPEKKEAPSEPEKKETPPEPEKKETPATPPDQGGK